MTAVPRYNEHVPEGILPALLARFLRNKEAAKNATLPEIGMTANDNRKNGNRRLAMGVFGMSLGENLLSDNQLRFNGAASGDAGYDAMAFRVDMDPDASLYQTNPTAQAPAEIDAIDAVAEWLQRGFADPVQERGTKSGPDAGRPDPALQAGIRLQGAFEGAAAHARNLDRAEAGRAFSAQGTGARSLDHRISGKEQAIAGLESALKDFKKLNPQADPARVPQAGGGMGGGMAKVALDAAIPVMPVVRAVAGMLSPEANGAGSVVTYAQGGGYSAGALDRGPGGYKGGYGMAAAASPAQDRADITQPSFMASPVDAADSGDLMGRIDHIVAPGMEGLRPGSFNVDQIRGIEACCAAWKSDAREARSAFETWQRGPVQATDANDVKEIPVQAFEADERQLAALSSDAPHLKSEPLPMLRTGMAMM